MVVALEFSGLKNVDVVDRVQWCKDHCSEGFFISPQPTMNATAFVYNKFVTFGWDEWKAKLLSLNDSTFSYWSKVYFVFDHPADAAHFKLRWFNEEI